MQLIQVKSLGGTNYFRVDAVIAIQTTATGHATIVLQGGAVVQSSEPPKDIAERVIAAMAKE